MALADDNQSSPETDFQASGDQYDRQDAYWNTQAGKQPVPAVPESSPPDIVDKQTTLINSGASPGVLNSDGPILYGTPTSTGTVPPLTPGPIQSTASNPKPITVNVPSDTDFQMPPDQIDRSDVYWNTNRPAPPIPAIPESSPPDVDAAVLEAGDKAVGPNTVDPEPLPPAVQAALHPLPNPPGSFDFTGSSNVPQTGSPPDINDVASKNPHPTINSDPPGPLPSPGTPAAPDIVPINGPAQASSGVVTTQQAAQTPPGVPTSGVTVPASPQTPAATAAADATGGLGALGADSNTGHGGV